MGMIDELRRAFWGQIPPPQLRSACVECGEPLPLGRIVLCSEECRVKFINQGRKSRWKTPQKGLDSKGRL